MEPKYTRSRFYRLATRTASQLIKNPKKLLALVDSATRKAKKYQGKALAQTWQTLSASFRLLKAYAKREYTDIALQKLILIIAAVSYFLMPFDAIPDFLINVGMIDDVALLIWTFKTVKDEIEKFRLWETPSIEQQPAIEHGQLIEGEWVEGEQAPDQVQGSEDTSTEKTT